ncbi:oxidoreductase [Nocardioides anomalus]|uniref:Oxidoreductase n=1 Tax=Nocardioides anomalus TaxID=2712223 RepID=A0A6G6WD21_9ACTN|nr:ferredoxin reductase family protein [Nocardioides anomalus]QIG42940.1 oxidoreductase [Nocardioides anomalus]
MTTVPTVARVPVARPRPSRAAADQGARLAAGATLWLSLLLVTYWWVADGGLGAPLAGGALVLSVGRLTGLVASVLLLAQVVLMARVPVLERAFGQDRLARVHRVVGFVGFDLMVTHVLTTSVGYAGGDLLASPGRLWRLVLDDPGMLLAAAGTLALVMVVVTSVRAARRRLRYESWHLLHLYAYLGVGLALPHQLWTGQQFVGSAARTLFWWTAWALAAVAVLVWRVGVPAYRTLRHDLRVTAVVPEAPGVVSVHVAGRDLHRMPVEAGQFLTWRFLAGPGWSRAHPYSLSAAPDGRRLRLTVKDLGDGSREVARLRPGTRVLVEGPHGRLSARVRTRRHVALVGAGVGITPLRALAEGLDYGPGEAVLVHRYAERPLFAEELAALSLERGLRVVDLPGSRTAPGNDPRHLLHHVPDLAHRDVYVCGPEEWATEIGRAALAAGLPPEHLHVETFRW